ncbi:hypothetical protein GGI12_003407 [Dipsacomyces acuminosporus]|nr:hypothetical protein GGI12_003407 [Dipsacomyces acuminosporus]
MPTNALTPAAASGPSGVAQLERERTYARKEWESERMEELSLEIRKLLGNPSSSPTTITPTSAKSPVSASVKSSTANLAPAQTSSVGTESLLDSLDLSQPLNLYRVPDGVMQVFVMSIMPSSPINRPYIVVRLGDQVFQTSVAKTPSGNWNEGFELIVSYHMQLFGTVHLDVYSSNTLLPDTHVGRAEIKISLLEGFPEIFTSYYEIWDKKMAASTVPDQRQRHILSKNLGALHPSIAKVRGAHIIGTIPGQLSAQASATGGGVNPADMPIEDLVAKFASEYNQYIEMVRKQGHMAIVRNSLAKDGTKSAVGFTRVDSDTYLPDVNGRDSASGADGKASSTSWFSDWFAAPSNANLEPTALSNDEQRGTVDQQDPVSPTAATAAAAIDNSQSKQVNDKTFMQSLASMFVSPSTFKAIKSIDRLATAFNQGVELSNTELLVGLLTLYKFYNQADLPGVTRPHRGTMIESVQELEIPGHYARFALASYGWRALYFFNRGITLMDGAKVNSDLTSVLQYLNITQEDLLGYEFRSSEVFCPSYFVAYDRPYNAVALVVRGTMSLEDTVVDLSCEYTKWNGGLVHSGMKASAHWLFAKVMPQIFAYATSRSIRSIRIVGHSLGGSTAAILTIMLHTLRERLGGLGVDTSDFDIKGFCYGPAPCISENLAERFKDCIETFVNKDDIIPRLCYGSVSDFKRMSICASDEADNLAQRLYAPFEKSEQQKQRWNEKFERLKLIREDIRSSQDNLHLSLPGVIHHIVAYRSTASKDKRTPKSPNQDIEVGKRELFGIGPDHGESTAGFTDTQPPPTPETKVRSDSVDPEDLADAINTSIQETAQAVESTPAGAAASGKATPSDDKKASNNNGNSNSNSNCSPSAIPASSRTFYPVWVQRVPAEAFRDIILRPTMITDHMPSAYESAFARAIETQLHEKRKKTS